MSISSRQNRRRALWRKDPRCFWCGKITILRRVNGGEQHPDNMATLEHIIHKMDPNRGKKMSKNKGKNSTVLACRECNNSRGSTSFSAYKSRHHKP